MHAMYGHPGLPDGVTHDDLRRGRLAREPAESAVIGGVDLDEASASTGAGSHRGCPGHPWHRPGFSASCPAVLLADLSFSSDSPCRSLRLRWTREMVLAGIRSRRTAGRRRASGCRRGAAGGAGSPAEGAGVGLPGPGAGSGGHFKGGTAAGTLHPGSARPSQRPRRAARLTMSAEFTCGNERHLYLRILPATPEAPPSL